MKPFQRPTLPSSVPALLNVRCICRVLWNTSPHTDFSPFVSCRWEERCPVYSSFWRRRPCIGAAHPRPTTQNGKNARRSFLTRGRSRKLKLTLLYIHFKSQDVVSIICVGSVFKSWHLLEKGFLQKLGVLPKRINIRYLTQSSAIGAAFLAAKACALPLEIDFSKNYSELCCYENGKIIAR